MAMLLKGGVDQLFPGFESLLDSVSDYEQEARSAAEKLSDSKFLCSAAWGASQNNYLEYSHAVYRAGRYDEGQGGFNDWHETSLHFQNEMSDAEDCLSQYRWQVNQDTVELIEVMGRWYDDLLGRSSKRNRRWTEEYHRFGKMHKEFVRRFWEYKQLLGKEVPAI